MNSPAKLFVLGLVATVCSPTLPAGTLDWVGGPSGRLLDGLNWSPEAVPTSADTLRFADVGEVAVTSDADAAPSGMSISNGDVAFDMGGHSLSFANGFNLSATAAYISSGTTPSCVFANGDYAVNGSFQTSKRARFELGGPAATLALNGSSSITGGSLMLVHGGATVTNNSTMTVKLADGLGSTLCVDNATWNAGASVNMDNGQSAAVHSTFRVCNGGQVNHVGIQRMDVGAWNELIVDGAGSKVAANQLAMQSSFSHVLVTNNASLSAKWCIWLGRGGKTYSNLVEVVDGGTASGPVWFGYNSENAGWPSSNNIVRVRNGTLTQTSNPFKLRDECSLELQGTNTTVTCSGSMQMFRGSRLVFFPPDAGIRSFDNAPLRISGAVTQIDADCRFIVDNAATKACAVRGGGTYVVATYSTSAPRFSIVEHSALATVTQTDTQLIVHVDDLSPSVLLFR